MKNSTATQSIKTPNDCQNIKGGHKAPLTSATSPAWEVSPKSARTSGEPLMVRLK